MCCERTERINATKRYEEKTSRSRGYETRGWIFSNKHGIPAARKWASDRYKDYEFKRETVRDLAQFVSFICYRTNEIEKKQKYNEHILQVENGSFIPLVFFS